MRVLVLRQAVSADSPPDERDVLVQAELVAAALAHLGHHVATGEATLDLRPLRRHLAKDPPELVFNLVESLDGEDELHALVPALLEALAIPFTGSGSAALLLANDKPRAKARLQAAGIPTAPWRWDGVSTGALTPGRCILKPARRQASQGIDARSVIDAADLGSLDAHLAARARELGVACFAERFVEGREVSVTLLAQGGALAVVGIGEIAFVDFPPERPRIVDYDAKWTPGSFAFDHTVRELWSPGGAPDLYPRVAQIALASAAALGVAGYARVDLRLDAAETPWVLEVNANPCLAPDAGFFAAAAAAGLGAPELCRAIVTSATASPGPLVPRG